MANAWKGSRLNHSDSEAGTKEVKPIRGRSEATKGRRMRSQRYFGGRINGALKTKMRTLNCCQALKGSNTSTSSAALIPDSSITSRKIVTAGSKLSDM